MTRERLREKTEMEEELDRERARQRECELQVSEERCNGNLFLSPFIL
jgi:hypothetical protein